MEYLLTRKRWLQPIFEWFEVICRVYQLVIKECCHLISTPRHTNTILFDVSRLCFPFNWIHKRLSLLTWTSTSIHQEPAVIIRQLNNILFVTLFNGCLQIYGIEVVFSIQFDREYLKDTTFYTGKILKRIEIYRYDFNQLNVN